MGFKQFFVQTITNAGDKMIDEYKVLEDEFQYQIKGMKDYELIKLFNILLFKRMVQDEIVTEKEEITKMVRGAKE